MKNDILLILVIIPLMFSSCDSKTAQELDGMWQCDDDASKIWTFDKQGELGGVCNNGNVWIVKFGTLYIKTGNYAVKHRIAFTNSKLKIDGNVYHRVGEEDATSGSDFAARLANLVTDRYTYSGLNKQNATIKKMGYTKQNLRKLNANTYAVYFDNIDCGENIYMWSRVLAMYENNKNADIIVDRFRMKDGTVPKIVATQIKENLEKKLGISMLRGKLGESITDDKTEKDAFWYDCGKFYCDEIEIAIIYDNSTLDFIVSFDNESFQYFVGHLGD